MTTEPTQRRSGRAGLPHVLVVEDDSAVRRVFTRMLAGAGFDVDTADNGRSALSHLAARRFDAIVCDIVMPQMDGMQLYQRIESDHPAEVERVMFVTGWAQEPPVAAFLDRCGRPHLTKPVDMNTLVGAVRRLTAREAPAPPHAPRVTVMPFSPEDADVIRKSIMTAGARVECPRCGRDLEFGHPVGGGGSIAVVWLLRCDSCQRSLIVRDLPEPPTSDPH